MSDNNAEPVRVVFAQSKNPNTGALAYRFAGVFAPDGIEFDEGLQRSRARYKRIDDRFEIIRHR